MQLCIAALVFIWSYRGGAKTGKKLGCIVLILKNYASYSDSDKFGPIPTVDYHFPFGPSGIRLAQVTQLVLRR